MTETLIIIQVVNELNNLKQIIREIYLNFNNFQLLIIDDNSDDGTDKWIKTLNKNKLHYIRRDKRFGVGNAHTTGILWAYKNNFFKVITMDGDLSHNPIYISEFINKSEFGYEFILSNRYNKNINTYKNWPLIKKLINKLGRLIIISLFNIKYDITTGYRFYNLKKIPISNFMDLKKYNHYEFFIVSGVLFSKKFKVSEVLIDMPYRVSGNSKMAFKHLLIWFITIFKLKFFI